MMLMMMLRLGLCLIGVTSNDSNDISLFSERKREHGFKSPRFHGLVAAHPQNAYATLEVLHQRSFVQQLGVAPANAAFWRHLRRGSCCTRGGWRRRGSHSTVRTIL